VLKSAEKHDEAVVKRVSRRHDEHGHSGAWKVAFADFCLALMCLFLVLWVMAARTAEQIEEVKHTAEGGLLEGVGRRLEITGGPRGSLIERNPVPSQGDVRSARRTFANGDVVDPTDVYYLSKTHYESPAEMHELAEVVRRLTAEAGLEGNLQTEVSLQGLRVMIHDTEQQGMFARGSAMPSERFRALLRRMGPLFARIDNQMLILGHTDALQYADRGPSAYSNWTLANERAMAARLNLIAGGMPRDSVLQVIGMAERAPLDTQNPRAAINRRIELMILGTRQAQNLAAMFGMPTTMSPLIDGVNTTMPRQEALNALRQGTAAPDQASPAPASGGH
jgi:chemotaxis protein MotB